MMEDVTVKNDFRSNQFFLEGDFKKKKNPSLGRLCMTWGAAGILLSILIVPKEGEKEKPYSRQIC